MSKNKWVIIPALVLFFVGWHGWKWYFGGWRMPEPWEINDGTLEERWLVTRDYRDAVEFLQAGGTFSFAEEVSDPDRDYLLPLMVRCKTELDVDTYAMLVQDHPDSASAIVIKLPPASEGIRQRVLATIDQADEEYPGEIWAFEGEDWIAVEMIDPAEVRRIEEMEAQELAAGD